MSLASAQTEVSAWQEREELARLLSVILQYCHLDFRDYAASSVKRRVLRRVAEEGTRTIGGLCELVLRDSAAMSRLLVSLTIHVTAMFRDAGFFLALRKEVVALLRTYPFIRLWVAGCSTGEEVYSLAILLYEEGLYDRCRIYATDMNERVVDSARAGIFPLSVMQEYTRNYQAAGGSSSFATYYSAGDAGAIFRPFLRENLVFACHNLSGDACFNEFHAIFCRNVLIYFNRSLQDRVHGLFHQSLLRLGYLGLGRSETVQFCSWSDCYQPVVGRERIYRKIK